MENSNSDEQVGNTTILFLCILIGLAVSGVVIITMHGSWSSSDGMTVMMCALAAMSVGAFLGFLFAIPKTKKEKKEDKESRSENDKTLSDDSRYDPNTSLEDISDWLTKIIIGVGLIELKEIGEVLQNLAKIIANSMTATDTYINHTPFIMALIVFYLILGFFISFLTTSFFLRKKLWESHLDIKKIQDQMKEFKDDIKYIDSSINRHTSLESVVAQSDFWLRKGEKMKASTPEGKKCLDRGLNGYERAIAIDPDNIPAFIGLAKYHAALKEYKKARDKLDNLKAKIIDKKDKWVDKKSYHKTIARIKYNLACYYFLDGKLNHNEEFIREAFKLLEEATSKEEEPLYKEYAKLDDDWDGRNQTEDDTFYTIVGR